MNQLLYLIFQIIQSSEHNNTLLIEHNILLLSYELPYFKKIYIYTKNYL